VVFNDNDYGLISWKQEISRGRSTGTRIGNPDFKAYAESFGIKARHPGSVGELRAAFVEAVGSRELRLIEIPVDTSVNRELVAKLREFWSRKKTTPNTASAREGW
jgi:acetolactate synthase-1/2/3 large subunit